MSALEEKQTVSPKTEFWMIADIVQGQNFIQISIVTVPTFGDCHIIFLEL